MGIIGEIRVPPRTVLVKWPKSRWRTQSVNHVFALTLTFDLSSFLKSVFRLRTTLVAETLFGCWKSRGGRPRVPQMVRELIVRMALEIAAR